MSQQPQFSGWKKSRRSNGSGNCVEVGAASATIGVRDTKLKGVSPVLAFSVDDWKAFLADIKR